MSKDDTISTADIDRYLASLRRLQLEYGALVLPCTEKQRAAVWRMALLLPDDSPREQTEEFICRVMLLLMTDDDAPGWPMLIHEIATQLITMQRVNDDHRSQT